MEGGSLSGAVILTYTFLIKAMPYACIPCNHSKPLIDLIYEQIDNICLNLTCIICEVTDPDTAPPNEGRYFGNFTACTKEKKYREVQFNSQHN